MTAQTPDNTDDTTPYPTTVEGFNARNAKRTALLIAQDLRVFADYVMRRASEFDSVGATRADQTYSSIASDIQQRLFNELSNAGFGRLIETAAQADIARAKGE